MSRPLWRTLPENTLGDRRPEEFGEYSVSEKEVTTKFKQYGLEVGQLPLKDRKFDKIMNIATLRIPESAPRSEINIQIVAVFFATLRIPEVAVASPG